RPADVDCVADPRASASDRFSVFAVSNNADVDEERIGRTRSVASYDRDAPFTGEVEQSSKCLVDKLRGTLGGHGDAHHRIPGNAAHRGDIAEIHGERLAAEQSRRRPFSAEVYAFDH